jgi:two-component system chemotaxis sensor kinase CheA
MSVTAGLLALFLEETEENIGALEAALLSLGDAPDDEPTLQTAFRAAHSIKGGAATFGFPEVVGLVHELEAVLDGARQRELTLDVERLEILLTAVDVVRTAMDSAANGQPPGEDAIARATVRLQQAMHTAPPIASPPPTDLKRPCRYRVSFVPEASFFRSGNDPLFPLRDLQRLGDTRVRVNLDGIPPWSTLDPENLHLSWTVDVTTTSPLADIKAVFDWVEDVATIEVIALDEPEPAAIGGDPVTDHAHIDSAADDDDVVGPPVFGPSTQALPASDVAKNGTRSNELTSIRVPTARLDALVDMIGELVITQALLTELNTEGGRVEGTRDALDELARSTRQIQEAVMRLRMQPINVVFSRMPRVVHDLATRMGKDVQLVILGEQTEVDKNVVQQMADPLMHLVRNALDHGLEMPAARIAAGKNPRGTVTMSAAHQAGQVVVEVRDDGAGVNRERVERRARDRGIVKEGERLSDDDVLELLFAPGFSTAEAVSDISGRGVGLDVVRSNIRALGGTIVIKSDPGRGSTFLIRLPLTVSIIDAQLIAVANEVYIVPLLSVVETIQLDRAHLRPIPGQRSVYTLRGQPLPVVRLRDELGLVDRPAATRELLMVVEGEGQRAAFIVDDIVGQQQVVLKSLEDNYQRLDCFVGASILGNGRVALILDVGRITTRSAATNRLRSIEASRLVTSEVSL